MTATRRKTTSRRPTRRRGKDALLVGTIKGAFVLEPDARRRDWKVRGPYFLGARVNDFRLDPRDGKTLLCTSGGGHLGPTLRRSTDRGKTWAEVKRPPKFMKSPAKPKKGEPSTTRGKSVKTCFWLEPGHADEPGVWYIGTSPVALFRSADGGDTWSEVKGFNHNPMWSPWTYDGEAGTPDGSMLHSILVDPRDPKHLYVSASGGGTFESADRGRSWKPLNVGVTIDFLPDPEPEYGHDPHCVVQHPTHPDRLYQQNHCGIYRLDRDQGERWVRIGRKMPKRVGDVGFPIVVHPTDPDTAWVLPMDGTRVWPRISPGGKPAVYRTRDGGQRWERQDKGFPAAHAYWTVKRQAMCRDDDPKRPGLYFGTTTGQLWSSANGGDSWRRITADLPHVYSVRWATFR